MLNRALFIIIGMSLLTACAQQPDDPQQSYYNPAYDPTSCEEFTPGLGEPADVSNIQVDDIRDSGYFAKPYDYADLEAVLRASPTQTALYGERLGVALNKVPRRASEGGPQPCRLFAFLKLPPPELMYLWQSVAGDGGEGILAGLYFENCPEDECPQDRVQKPTIMIDDSMDRWTLVHEMTHHNFNKERKQRDDFQSNTQLRKIIESEKKAYHTANNLSNAATHLERLTQATYRFLVQTIFEEIAVEGLLL
ncbi:MAG TPA: hypothetical protein VM432_02150 [Bdellovibrionales bacterium]|nr:hypothetical protein [Bdellovibrionales bacterium]